ncbi:MAG: hypothetical protein ACOZNI_05970 [Myxococcota bacterium]
MDLSGSSMFASVLFGCVGLAAWQIGRRRSSARAMVLGCALLGFTFVTPPGWPTWVVGAALTLLLFWT